MHDVICHKELFYIDAKLQMFIKKHFSARNLRGWSSPNFWFTEGLFMLENKGAVRFHVYFQISNSIARFDDYMIRSPMHQISLDPYNQLRLTVPYSHLVIEKYIETTVIPLKQSLENNHNIQLDI